MQNGRSRQTRLTSACLFLVNEPFAHLHFSRVALAESEGYKLKCRTTNRHCHYFLMLQKEF